MARILKGGASMELITIFMIIFMASAAGVLVLGLISMIRGGTFDAKYSNRLMQLRIFFQVLALIMLAILIIYHVGK